MLGVSSCLGDGWIDLDGKFLECPPEGHSDLIYDLKDAGYPGVNGFNPVETVEKAGWVKAVHFPGILVPRVGLYSDFKMPTQRQIDTAWDWAVKHGHEDSYAKWIKQCEDNERMELWWE